MPTRVSNVAAQIAAWLLFAALAGCLNSGSGNPFFTHPYNGPNGSNSVTGSPGPDGTGTSATDSNDLLAGAASGAGTATFSGTVKGTTFTPTVAIFDAEGPNPNNPLAVTLVLANNANFCADVASNGNLPAGSSYALVRMLAVDGNMETAAVAPGNYNIVTFDELADQQDAGNYASLDFYALDNLCLQSLADSYYRAQSGSLSLTAISANPNGAAGLGGTMTVSLGAQKDTLAATFQAAPCAGLSRIASDTNGLNCQ